MVKRILLTFFGLLATVVLLFLLFNYKSDLPVEKLIEKHGLADSEFMEMDGMQVHYRQTGEGPPLLLIHGFGGNLWHWKDWTSELDQTHKVVSLDLPGFGLTGPHPAGDYSTKMYIDFIDRFMTKLSIDTFHLGGNSMGGGFAWQYAVQYPEKIRKLILVNSSGYPRDGQSGKMLLGFRLLQMPVINQLVTKITPRSILKKTVEDVYADPTHATPQEVDFYSDMLRRSGNRRALVQRMAVAKEDLSPEIKKVKAPTLIVWGDRDRLIPFENAYQFERDIPSAKAIVYENVGHVPQMEIPERSVRDVIHFLSESSPE